jgi:hypothetical protein
MRSQQLAAINRDRLAGHPAGQRRGQEDDDPRHLLGVAEPAERDASWLAPFVPVRRAAIRDLGVDRRHFPALKNAGRGCLFLDGRRID